MTTATEPEVTDLDLVRFCLNYVDEDMCWKTKTAKRHLTANQQEFLLRIRKILATLNKEWTGKI